MKTFGFCSGQAIIMVTAENLANAYINAVGMGAETDVPLTPIVLDPSWGVSVRNNETLH